MCLEEERRTSCKDKGVDGMGASTSQGVLGTAAPPEATEEGEGD